VDGGESITVKEAVVVTTILSVAAPLATLIQATKDPAFVAVIMLTQHRLDVG
jgi:hypothetical protein